MSSYRAPGGPHIIVVCTANAIRSPFVENLLRERLTRRGLSGIELESAGTAARPGGPAEEGARALARAHGVSLDAHRTRRLDERMLRENSAVLCAERAHRRVVLGMRPDLVGAVFTIREFARLLDIARPAGSLNEWSSVLSATARARFGDRHVSASEDDILDPIGQDAPVWAAFERQATSAVDIIVEAMAGLAQPGTDGGSSARPTTRREYRAATRASAHETRV
ncbi:protein-tyrosine-phosphatase [Microbacterium testaceum StLB037]|uniref:Protein-tyrosine-phosphatase n=1 Tax=Microbacterium testaceum (strain StLB037) TaxID=979556 RepID=E8NEE6_MICTS|nr:protein-tyrosine-phosphatase [Microbacterium testaceum]BAJ73812.1 protein-tyrosine-phosphatase [Microbacterium testaceum StLB037]